MSREVYPAAELFSPGPFFPPPKSLNGTVHDCVALTLTSLCSMRIILLLASIFAFLSLSVMDEPRHFKCGASLCGQTFNTSGGLLRHRPTCIHYQQQSVAIRSKSRHKRLVESAPLPSRGLNLVDQSTNRPLHMTVLPNVLTISTVNCRFKYDMLVPPLVLPPYDTARTRMMTLRLP